VYTGLPEPTRLANLSIPENTRVTIKFRSSHPSHGADAVAPSAPREEAGYYWGYSVRRCASLSDVFTECPFEGGYDVSFGTSERGDDLSEVLQQQDPLLPKFEHLVIVFGGVAGLEAAVKVDKELEARGVKPGEARRLFDYWVNLLPGQGSRTIRTEEAVWLGLMGLRGLVQRNSTL
jgi:predicted SPOUT superfamily RNA methylase MTH1